MSFDIPGNNKVAQYKKEAHLLTDIKDLEKGISYRGLEKKYPKQEKISSAIMVRGMHNFARMVFNAITKGDKNAD